MTIQRVYEDDQLTVYHGRAEDCPKEWVDLVVTNPYGLLPEWLRGDDLTPMLLHQWRHRQRELMHWSGQPELVEVSGWNKNREVFWSANVATPVVADLTRYAPVPPGWYPEAMVHDLLIAVGAAEGMTLWDGFLGRGTVAKVAMEMGLRVVGVDQLPAHLALAAEYLGKPFALGPTPR